MFHGVKSSLIYCAIIIIGVFPEYLHSTWDFSSVGLSNDLLIWKFAIWRNRAFLAVSTYERSEYDARRAFTLLEAHWPEPGNDHSSHVTAINSNDKLIRVFPNSSIDDKRCSGLDSVVGLDVDPRGRLWILDSSENTNCHAQIVVYDLKRNYFEIARTELKGVKKKKLRTLVVDPYNSYFGPRAYIGDPDDGSIIVFSLFKKRWWRLRIHNNKGGGLKNFDVMEMAISRKNQLLYMTDARSLDLFSLDLAVVRIEPELFMSKGKDLKTNATINLLGTKMGISSGLAIDQRDGLHYFLVTEHASVRWDTRRDLNARNYAILLQSADVPCITDYRLDSQRNVWGLVNIENPLVKNRNSIFHGDWKSRFRTVKIFKQNSLTP